MFLFLNVEGSMGTGASALGGKFCSVCVWGWCFVRISYRHGICINFSFGRGRWLFAENLVGDSKIESIVFLVESCLLFDEWYLPVIVDIDDSVVLESVSEIINSHVELSLLQLLQVIRIFLSFVLRFFIWLTIFTCVSFRVITLFPRVLHFYHS